MTKRCHSLSASILLQYIFIIKGYKMLIWFSVLCLSQTLNIWEGIYFFYSKYILVDAICHAPKLDRLVLKPSHSINHFWKSNDISAMGFLLLIILKFITSKVHSDKVPFHKTKGCRRNVDTSTNKPNKSGLAMMHMSAWSMIFFIHSDTLHYI